MPKRYIAGRLIFVPGGKNWSHGKTPNSNCCDNCAKHRNNHFVEKNHSGIDLGIINFGSSNEVLYCYQ